MLRWTIRQVFAAQVFPENHFPPLKKWNASWHHWTDLPKTKLPRKSHSTSKKHELFQSTFGQVFPGQYPFCTHRFLLLGVMPKSSTVRKDLIDVARLVRSVFYFEEWYLKLPPCGKTYPILSGYYLPFFYIEEEFREWCQKPPPCSMICLMMPRVNVPILLWGVMHKAATLWKTCQRCKQLLRIFFNVGRHAGCCQVAK